MPIARLAGAKEPRGDGLGVLAPARVGESLLRGRPPGSDQSIGIGGGSEGAASAANLAAPALAPRSRAGGGSAAWGQRRCSGRAARRGTRLRFLSHVVTRELAVGGRRRIGRSRPSRRRRRRRRCCPSYWSTRTVGHRDVIAQHLPREPRLLRTGVRRGAPRRCLVRRQPSNRQRRPGVVVRVRVRVGMMSTSPFSSSAAPQMSSSEPSSRPSPAHESASSSSRFIIIEVRVKTRSPQQKRIDIVVSVRSPRSSPAQDCASSSRSPPDASRSTCTSLRSRRPLPPSAALGLVAARHATHVVVVCLVCSATHRCVMRPCRSSCAQFAVLCAVPCGCAAPSQIT